MGADATHDGGMRIPVAIALTLFITSLSVQASTEPAFVPPVPGAVLRHFEPPPTEFSPGHRGIDLASPVGTPVRASEAGTVTFAGQVGGRLFLTISHGELRSTYSFLSGLLVEQNAIVARDQVVARTGEGHQAGDAPHLHFSIRRGEQYLDPEPYLLATVRAEPWRVVRLVP